MPLSPSRPRPPQPTAASSVRSAPLLCNRINSRALRLGVPLLLCVNIAFFVTGHLARGASVDLVVDLLGERLELPSVFTFSLAQSTMDMWNAGATELAVLLVVFSGAWPYLKMVTMLILWVAPAWFVSAPTRGKTFAWLDVLGKWSMIDIFITVLCLVAFRIHATNPSPPSPSLGASDALLAPNATAAEQAEHLAASLVAPLLPESLFAVDLYVTMQWGLYANLIAQLLSQLASHAATYAHLRAMPKHDAAMAVATGERASSLLVEVRSTFGSQLPATVAAEGADASLRVGSMPLLHAPSAARFAPRAAARMLVGLMPLAGAVLAIIGCVAPSFTIAINGVAGVLLESATREGQRATSYSVVSVVQLLVDQAEASKVGAPGGLGGWLGMYLLVSVFVLCALMVPVLQCATLGVLWAARLPAPRLRRLLIVNEVLASWQYLEVYLIGLIVLIMQIGQVSRFMVDEVAFCRDRRSFALPARLGLLAPADAECFFITAGLERGATLLLAAAILLNLANQLISRRARACLAACTAPARVAKDSLRPSSLEGGAALPAHAPPAEPALAHRTAARRTTPLGALLTALWWTRSEPADDVDDDRTSGAAKMLGAPRRGCQEGAECQLGRRTTGDVTGRATSTASAAPALRPSSYAEATRPSRTPSRFTQRIVRMHTARSEPAAEHRATASSSTADAPSVPPLPRLPRLPSKQGSDVVRPSGLDRLGSAGAVRTATATASAPAMSDTI